MEDQNIGTNIQDHYELEQNSALPGMGKYGLVKKAKRRVNGVKVAVKEVQKSSLTLERLENGLPLESKILSFLSHLQTTPELYDCFETPSSFHLAMKLLPGQTLMEFVRANGPLEEHLAAKIFGQLVKAVKDLQDSGVLHGNLKEDNIMIYICH